MLQKIHSENDKVVAFRFDGKYDKEAFKRSLEEFLPELKSRDRMNVYFELFALQGIEPGAVWEDIKFTVRNYSELTSKIDKLALVTDESWVSNLATVSSAVFPGIELKTYSFAKSDEAIAWINE